MYSKSESLIHRAAQILSREVPSLHRALKRPKSRVARVLGLTGKPAGSALFTDIVIAPLDLDFGAVRILVVCMVLLLGWLY